MDIIELLASDFEGFGFDRGLGDVGVFVVDLGNEVLAQEVEMVYELILEPDHLLSPVLQSNILDEVEALDVNLLLDPGKVLFPQSDTVHIDR